jgi:hypothetical protein
MYSQSHEDNQVGIQIIVYLFWMSGSQGILDGPVIYIDIIGLPARFSWTSQIHVYSDLR